LLIVSLLACGAIWFTSMPSEAQEAAKGKGKAKAVAHLVIPGAGQKLDAAALTRIIDQEVKKQLDANGVKSSPRTDDAEFVRRVYLDLIGVIPTAEQARAFLDSTDPDKRTKLVEELLANPRFGEFMAETWRKLMIVRDTDNRLLQAKPLDDWLAKAFNSGTPWDKIVYQLITAAGEQEQNPAITYFAANGTADKITDSVTKLFLGVQLQCAQCHNHPFTNWKQNEYWAMAAFFMKTTLTVNPKVAAKKGLPVTVVDGAAVKAKKKGLPESAKFVPAKFLQGAQPKVGGNQPLRPVLAQWMIAKDNPFFARAMVNRTWAHFFGRGMVNPVDDMHDENPATHPELLAALTEQFKANVFDVKYLIRAIVSSEAYQRSSRPVAGNETDTELYSRAQVRVVTPEQLYDSLVQVVGLPKGGGAKKGVAPQKKGVGGPREQFLNFFGVDEGVLDPLEYQAGIPQALRLMNAPQLNNTQGAITQAMKDGKEPARVIENLFLATLSRRPTSAELTRMLRHTREQATDPQAAYRDILWALLNSSEFVANR
jgi:hypothetical protein